VIVAVTWRVTALLAAGSPFVILDDTDLDQAVALGVRV